MENIDDLRTQALSYAAAAVPAIAIALALWPWRGARILPLPRLRRGRWSGRDVFVAYLAMALVPALLMAMLRNVGPFQDDDEPARMRQVLWLGPLALPAILSFAFIFMHAVAATRPADLGFSFVRIVPNAILGVGGFVLATPFLLALHFALSRLWPMQPHFLERLATEQTLGALDWILLWFQVAVFAPIIEEWFFRGVLQGWLRRASPAGHAVVLTAALLVGSVPLLNHLAESSAKMKLSDTLDNVLANLTFAVAVGTAFGACAVLGWRPLIREGLAWFLPMETKADVPALALRDESPDDDDEDVPEHALASEEAHAAELARKQRQEEELRRIDEIVRQPKWQSWQQWMARVAVLGSAMLFAMFHMSWPAPVPIFLLGLLLGWLQLRTQNLWPGIVLHSLFNQVAFVSLVLGTIHKP